ncbi:rho GTPase-activating protein 27 isoform X3 [Cyclopterus lumpus]|uniref:rho GTPase-activating protein 27 isoform X3 n=1 Tax=Cyclopterus lumpus TaxID=8103 RepID=UPI001486EDA6|nr:rho GTPase-activating protein 27 isoform X3 [Cyclopterus lumpus]
MTCSDRESPFHLRGVIIMATTSSLLSPGLGLVLVEFHYNYQGRDGVPVSIKPNERYVLLAKTNDHWWQVQRDRGSKPFYIPAKYVKELPIDFPSPLDFDPPGPEPVLLPVTALVPVPIPVPVPVPKTLEEPRTKPGDEVMIRLRPDASKGYRKTENRMSTFGVPLDFHDSSSLVTPASRHPSNPPVSPRETGTTNMADDDVSKKHLSQDQVHMDLDKSRVPSFSPADPVSTLRSQTQPILVETPVVPMFHSDHQESPIEPKEELEEDSSGEEGPRKEEDSNHIYESIQDLNLDLEALVGGKGNPGAPSEPTPAPPLLQKTNIPQISISGSALPSSPPPGPTPSIPGPSSSSSTSRMMSPASPLRPQDRWQVHTDQDSGKEFYFHPVTRETTWSDPHGPPPPPYGDLDQSRDSEGGQLTSPSPVLSPDSSQGSASWQQLVDEVSGRFYYHNPTLGATSWAGPVRLSSSSPPAESTASRRNDDGPPPLPEEDYPSQVHNDDVFTTNPLQPVCLIPRAQLDLRYESGSQFRLQEVAPLPQNLMGNGVSGEGTAVQVKNWRHSIAEETVAHSHRRNVSEFIEASNRRPSPDSPQTVAHSHRRNVSEFIEASNRRPSPDSPQLSDLHKLKRNLSDRSSVSDQHHVHLLEKAGIMNKTKVVDHGKKIRKNWSQSWTVLHGGILTFHKDPKSAPTGTAGKTSQIVPEYTVELRGASVGRAAKDKSSKKNVLELKTRQGCEYLMQYDTESIINDWLKVMQDTMRQLEQDHVSEDEDEAASDKEDKDRKRSTSRSSSSDTEQRRVRTKLRRFLQRRPTLESVKERGYIRDNVFGCHLDTLSHRENSTTPRFMEKCIRAVERRGLDVDGIYRVSGNLAVIQKLRHKADHEEQLDLEDGQWEEIHVIAGALKLFLRELPEPLFPFSCFDKFIAAIQVQDYSQKVSYMKDLVSSLPLPNHDTMELLFKHLRRVIEHKESNRMSFQSVGIVFGPTLLRPQTESSNMTIHMVFQSQIVELMLKEFHAVFSQR